MQGLGEQEQHQHTELLLPPGFRFFPTDEELITCYLARKAMDASFSPPAIRDVDLYNTEPWDLPCEQQAAAAGGDLHEGYFFCTRGSKSPSGVRARRATRLGYWKSTGKDKAVRSRSGRLVGTRKTLVFYRGRAPRGEKTGWVMHEYAMGDRSSSALLRGAQSEWVICRVFMRKLSDDRKLETEEAVVHDDDHPSPGHLLVAMEPDGGFDSQPHQQEVAPPAVAENQHTVVKGDQQQLQMNHEEELLMMKHRHHGSCWPLNHDDSALPIVHTQFDDADYYLPELLEYSGPLDTGGEEDRRAETEITSAASSHLDGLFWNIGF